jgi:hypothetical protein
MALVPKTVIPFPAIVLAVSGKRSGIVACLLNLNHKNASSFPGTELRFLALAPASAVPLTEFVDGLV